ncbi:MAG: MMPL family transporter [Nitrososphaerota archaeon]|nr:MMPL family transporter [Nitrososphaerota archaeon]MDG6967617.1 MMPL family transporter [Nitrososphaerota archaeon]MDG6979354.1 MMPL family transporter [Nitrososphaerota archaeon]MDG7020625.1 MMPL family transporter [Nitrososphaerota archaeon]
MQRSRFHAFNAFLRRYYKVIVVLWVVAVLVAGTQIPVFFRSVSYDVTGSNFGGPTNAQSQVTQKIIDTQFPSQANSSGDGIIVVLQNHDMYSAAVQSAVLALNRTVAGDPALAKNFTGMSSLYSTEYSFLGSLLPSLVQQVAQLNLSVSAQSQATHPLTAQQSWDVAAGLVANATASSFSSSPLFTVDGGRLAALLSSMDGAATPSQVKAVALASLVNQTYPDYPLVLSRSLTSNFVSPDNGTMIVVYNFASSPSVPMITAFRNDIANSSVPGLGTYYVTGAAVLTQDISKVFGPVIGVTVVPGVVGALAIVGVMLFAPLAALIPVVIGGIAIAVALPTIYYGVVVLGHGTLTFLTPALTILLTLGLAVDYSVLQLRRTKEERTRGRSTEESVAISVRWAGQAVLTAGITVVVAYIVMAVANVPLFSGVGTAIATAVAILILAALTLLPSLELLLKDSLFWPGLKPGMVKRPKKARLERLAERTHSRRAAIVVVIAAVAIGAFFVSQSTPSGANILKLFPDFPSNQGLTVITDQLGSSATAPTSVVVTTPTPIVYGNGQFNYTLLEQIDRVSSVVASVPGVSTTSGPTRPYGSSFNYTGLASMPAPVASQYLAGMRSYIGLNNETASIIVGLQSDGQSQAAVNTLLALEKAVSSQQLLKGVAVHYGGETQSTYDNQSFLDGILPEVVAVLGVAVYFILLIQLRSVFTPIRLIFTILCSVAFSMALLVLVYFYAQGLPILDFAPLFVVVTMLGVGIDYDIFFVTRIREEVLNGSSNKAAIVTALDRVWVTIFGLGLILATVFTSLIVTGIALLGEIGFVVAAAVMVDVGIVILFFVPALMAIAQRFNWWPTKVLGVDAPAGEEKPVS